MKDPNEHTVGGEEKEHAATNESSIELMLRKCPAKFVYAYRCEQYRSKLIAARIYKTRREPRECSCRCYDCPFCPKPHQERYDLVGFQNVRLAHREVVLTVSKTPMLVMKTDGTRMVKHAFHPKKVVCTHTHMTSQFQSAT